MLVDVGRCYIMIYNNDLYNDNRSTLASTFFPLCSHKHQALVRVKLLENARVLNWKLAHPSSPVLEFGYEDPYYLMQWPTEELPDCTLFGMAHMVQGFRN